MHTAHHNIVLQAAKASVFFMFRSWNLLRSIWHLHCWTDIHATSF